MKTSCNTFTKTAGTWQFALWLFSPHLHKSADWKIRKPENSQLTAEKTQISDTSPKRKYFQKPRDRIRSPHNIFVTQYNNETVHFWTRCILVPTSKNFLFCRHFSSATTHLIFLFRRIRLELVFPFTFNCLAWNSSTFPR